MWGSSRYGILMQPSRASAKDPIPLPRTKLGNRRGVRACDCPLFCLSRFALGGRRAFLAPAHAFFRPLRACIRSLNVLLRPLRACARERNGCFGEMRACARERHQSLGENARVPTREGRMHHFEECAHRSEAHGHVENEYAHPRKECVQQRKEGVHAKKEFMGALRVTRSYPQAGRARAQ